MLVTRLAATSLPTKLQKSFRTFEELNRGVITGIAKRRHTDSRKMNDLASSTIRW